MFWAVHKKFPSDVLKLAGGRATGGHGTTPEFATRGTLRARAMALGPSGRGNGAKHEVTTRERETRPNATLAHGQGTWRAACRLV